MEKLGRLTEQWTSLLTKALALVMTAAAFLRELDPRNWSWREFSLTATAVILLVAAYLWSRRSTVSKLADPESLKLDPRSPEHLIGRRDDLARLLVALADSLVFLVSESGCGKSALLRAGVMHDPGFTERFLPIYIDMSPLDWETQPLRAVREGFARALPDDFPDRARLTPDSDPQAFAEAFLDCYRRLLRRPLLLMDQFDDFQANPRHRDRFLPPETRVWRGPGAIEPDNAFWRMLRHCLAADTVSLIVACREDAAMGLESLRFQSDIPPFALPRLERGLVRTIIDRVTERPADKPAVIENPAGGWTGLRDRLVDDLEERGAVLPQQLRVALGALRTLRRLTPAAYARVGRVGGLEAAFVSGAMDRAARASKIRDGEVLRMLLALVDRDRQPPDKARPRAAGELAEIAGVAEPNAALALRQLEMDDVVRRQGDEAKAGWQLDHAYLARPVLRVERDRDQWRQLLIERARSFAESRRWAALLSMGTQVWLLAARLRGRFRYGEHGGYAMKSLARWVPGLALVCLMLATGWYGREYLAAVRIESNLARNGSTLSDNAARGLAELASRSWVTRDRIENDIFGSPVHAEWFNEAPGPVLRALIRLDPGRLNSLVLTHVTGAALRQRDRHVRSAVNALAAATSFAALDDRVRAAFQHAFLDGPGSIDPGTLANGATTISAALSATDPAQAKTLAALREAMGKTTDSDQLSALAEAYAAVAAKLPAGDPRAPEELAALREAMGKTTDSDRLRALAQAYTAVSAKLPADDPRAQGELAVLREAMGKTTDSGQLSALARAYAAVAAKASMASPPLQDIATILGRMSELRTSDQAVAFAEALMVAVRLGSDPLPRDKVGLIVSAALLQPVSAGEATRYLVTEYETLVRADPEGSKRLTSPWSGDVWAFAVWARQGNLPGFDPDRPNVGFLPAVRLSGRDGND